MFSNEYHRISPWNIRGVRACGYEFWLSVGETPETVVEIVDDKQGTDITLVTIVPMLPNIIFDF